LSIHFLRQALAEAEAELALMKSIGIIDTVITNDSDIFLFGALTVIQKWVLFQFDWASLFNPVSKPSWNAKRDNGTIRVFQTDTMSMPRESFILFGLLVGGDYDNNVRNSESVVPRN
jgi:hypothetical protein